MAGLCGGMRPRDPTPAFLGGVRPAAPPPRRPAAEHALSPASCPRLARWDSAPRNVQGKAYALCES